MAQQAPLPVPSQAPAADILVITVDQMTAEDRENALQTKSKVKMNLRFAVYQRLPVYRGLAPEKR